MQTKLANITSWLHFGDKDVGKGKTYILLLRM